MPSIVPRLAVFVPSLAMTILVPESSTGDGPGPHPKRGTISGSVIIDGKKERGVAGAKVLGISSGSYEIPNLVVDADSQGRFHTERGLDKMIVHAQSPDGALAGIVEISSVDSEVVIPVGPTAIVTGILLDVQGRPMANREVSWGVRVGLDDVPDGYRLCFGSPVTTDDAGRFRLPGIVVGWPYYVSVSEGIEHRYRRVTTITAEKPGLKELGTVRLGTKEFP